MEYQNVSKINIEDAMKIRLEMLKEVNNLQDDVSFDQDFIQNTKNYFLQGDQTTVLAFDQEKAVACATISYIDIIPTFSHPTGKRAHLMNVYTQRNYRLQGIAEKMIRMLMEEAKTKGVTEISLDATECGRQLYEKIGFVSNTEGMVMNI